MPIARLEAASFGVQYVEGPEALTPAELAAAPHEALILEPLNHATGYDAAGAAAGRAEIETIQAGGKQVFLYMSVGETSDLRSWWDPAWTTTGDDLGALTAAAPEWISDWFSGASGEKARLTHFWTPEWLAALKQEIDFLIGDLGADGLFLDNVASYFEWLGFDGQDNATDPADDPDQDAAWYASAMADLVVAVSDYARSLNPDVLIIANGDPFLPWNTGDRFGKGEAFLDAISAMMQEGVYHSDGVRDDNAARGALKSEIVASGIPVLALDYVDQTDQATIDAFVRDAVRDGFLPYAEALDLALDGLRPALNQPTAGADTLWLGPETGTLDALAGDDDVTGSEDDDRAILGPGDDTMRGEGGEDTAVVAAARAAVFLSATPRGDGGVDLALGGGLGTDVLHDVEHVAFSDGTVALTTLISESPMPGPNGRPVSFSPVVEDGRVRIAWSVTNDGDQELPAADVRFFIAPVGGAPVELGESRVSTLGAGQTAAAPGSLFLLPGGIEAGAHVVSGVYDPDDEASETNETDNAFVPVEVEVTAGDGRPSALTPFEAATRPGAELGLRVTIRNDGDLALPEAEIALRLEDPTGALPTIELGTEAFPAIAPGGSLQRVFRQIVPAGAQTGAYRAVVVYDPSNALAEPDEANNRLVNEGATVTVAPPLAPNLAPDGLTAEGAGGPGAAVAPGAALDLIWRLGNDGAVAAAASDWTAVLIPVAGGPEVTLTTGAAPVVGNGLVVDLVASPTLPGDLAAGDYDVEIRHDPADAIAESDEGDNVVAARIAVSADFTEGDDTVTLTRTGPWLALGGNDSVTGTNEGDTVDGGAGDDTLDGRDGADSLTGGKGRDRLLGGLDDDALDGSGGGDEILGGEGDDVILGGNGRDDLFGEKGDDRVEGGGRDDFLVGAGGSDTLDGGAGADEIEGDAKRDALIGGSGADELDGGGGRDTLTGGRGDDAMKGGGGADLFVVARGDGDDEIVDFGGRDRVDLSDFGFASARAVLRRIERDGGSAELSLPGGGEIDFAGLRPGDFDAGDFVL